MAILSEVVGLDARGMRAFLKKRYGTRGGHGSTAELYLAALMVPFGWGPHRLIPQFQIGPHRVDFIAPEARTIVEVDGIYHEMKTQRAKDRALDDLAHALGLVVLREPEPNVLMHGEFIAKLLSRELDRAVQRYSS